MKDDRLYLIRISECLARLDEYLEGADSQTFAESTLLQDAVLRNLQVLTESTQQLSDSLKTAYPSIDWRSISGFRNILVHDYLGVDIERIWIIVQKDIPSLKHEIETIIDDLPPAD